MSNTNKIVTLLIGVILFVASVGIVFNMTTNAQTYPTNISTFTYGVVPQNMTLNDCVSLTSVTNGSDVLPADNYTLYCSDDKLEFNENVTWLPATTYTVTYTYDDGLTVTGIAGTLLGLVGLLFIIWFVVGITRNNNK